MSSHYIFNEAGCIPGIPGTFANCRVDIDDEGTLTVTPLSLAGLTYSGGGGPLIVQEVLEAPQEEAPTNVASESEQQAEPAPVEAPAPEPEPQPQEPPSPPIFENGG